VADRIFISVFALLLAAPLLQMATRFIPEPYIEELRRPNSVPEPLARLVAMDAHLADDINGWFNDRFVFRSVLIRLKNEVDYQLFRTSEKSISDGTAGYSIKTLSAIFWKIKRTPPAINPFWKP
jgi:hypothetical protein